jgi:Flp pilus assembly protein TadD
MAIRGRLSEAALSDVVQLLAMGRKVGRLGLSTRGALGHIFFHEGRVIHASIVNRLIPAENAVYEMFSWTEGTFSFEPGVEPDILTPRLSIDPQSVMLEAARRVDEWSVISKKISSPALVFAVNRELLLQSSYELTATQRALLPLIDGHRDVAALEEAANLGSFEIGKALYGLLAAGFVVQAGSREREGKTTPLGAADHRTLGIAYYDGGMLEEATRELKSALTFEPKDARAHFYLGLVALRRRDWRGAIDAMRRVIPLAPTAVAPYVNAAFAYEKAGQLEHARKMLAEAALRGMTDERLRINAAALALRMGALGAARAQLELARNASVTPTPSAPWFHYSAVIAVRNGDLAGARNILEEGLKAHPEAAALSSNLAAVLLSLGDAQAARQCAERAVAAGSRLPQLQHNLIVAQERLGIRRATPVTPANPWRRGGSA